MKLTRIVAVFCVLGAMTATSLAKKETKAAEPSKDAAADAMAKYSTPGPQHKALKSMAGSWTIAGKMWMEPGKPPLEFKSNAQVKTIGDLWVVEDVTGDFMGSPFIGHGVHGYDLTKQKYVGTWIDNYGTFMMNSEGTGDVANKVITSTANDFDPMTGKTGTVKEVLTIDSDKKHTMTMFKTRPDGKDVKIMERVYTKN
jgi:hypothetical protein